MRRGRASSRCDQGQNTETREDKNTRQRTRMHRSRACSCSCPYAAWNGTRCWWGGCEAKRSNEESLPADVTVVYVIWSDASSSLKPLALAVSSTFMPPGLWSLLNLFAHPTYPLYMYGLCPRNPHDRHKHSTQFLLTLTALSSAYLSSIVCFFSVSSHCICRRPFT